LNSNIKKSLLNGRLVLLLGAGASRGCVNRLGNEIPMAWELAKILADEMGETYSGEDLSETYSAAKETIGTRVNNIFEKYWLFPILWGSH
jgi:hypothetical protein